MELGLRTLPGHRVGGLATVRRIRRIDVQLEDRSRNARGSMRGRNEQDSGRITERNLENHAGHYRDT